ncbi:hypothetical protein SLEP1_g26348 [Rubroshorea leprosula]|uniref:Uncharacterized protein n=1 Tax=Rubroshorea leprosula TaxID=152421 RepID=A0AAV5JXE9_9ROSI|nr:hypothetical protein SLEP1_g26348 [Rubroshorea leprosula]
MEECGISRPRTQIWGRDRRRALVRRVPQVLSRSKTQFRGMTGAVHS